VKQTIRLSILSFIFFSPATLVAEPQNYCHDPAAALAWDQLVEVSPNDLELQRLHALRLGICEKIKVGSLSLDQGMTIFEAERERAVQKRFEEGRLKEKALKQ